jgi:hypothetical protein
MRHPPQARTHARRKATRTDGRGRIATARSSFPQAAAALPFPSFVPTSFFGRRRRHRRPRGQSPRVLYFHDGSIDSCALGCPYLTLFVLVSVRDEAVDRGLTGAGNRSVRATATVLRRRNVCFE